MFFAEDDLLLETEASVEVISEPLYCICQEPWDKHNRRFMIQCDYCKDWFHGSKFGGRKKLFVIVVSKIVKQKNVEDTGSCIGLQEYESHDIEKYHCSKCVLIVGPSQNKEAGKKPIQAGTQEFIRKLKEKVFPCADEIILKLRGQSLTLSHLMYKGFSCPVIVENTNGLNLKVPPNTFTVRDVEKYVGPDRMVDVIDVQRQKDIKMTMREFTEYFYSPARNRLLNLISLEFSKTNLSHLVEAPDIARKLDWVATSWPANLDEEIAQRPEVSKYCLVSPKDSYTDFHIDFGGTSVWYHILWGEKIFYLIEPTPGNIALYARWMASVDQYESFLADSVDNCYQCVLKQGQTLFIPTGWIHAVLTPCDSLVFGGNFLHSLKMDLQLQIYEIEKKLNVPAKYLFPGFEAIHWFAGQRLLDDLQTLNGNGNVPHHILVGAKALISAFKLWSSDKMITGPNYIGKYRREFIPPNINPHRLVKDLAKEVRKAEKHSGGGKPVKTTVMEDRSSLAGTVTKVDVEKEKQLKLVDGTGIGKEKDAGEIFLDPFANTGSSSGNGSTNNNLIKSPSNTKKEEEKVVYKISKVQKKIKKLSKVLAANLDSQSPHKQVTPIKLKLTMSSSSKYSPESQESSLVQSPKYRNGEKDAVSPPSLPLTNFPPAKDHLPKLRLSLAAGEGRVEVIEADPFTESQDSDQNMYGGDSDNELRIDTDEDRRSADERSNIEKTTASHGKSKCKKHRKSKCKKKNDRNVVLDEMLAGTLDGINELIKSSNYTERINAYAKDSSPLVKESFQDMLTMGEEVIQPKRGRPKRRFKSNTSGYDIFDEAIEKVHQDDDFIYLPLAGSDDEGKTKKGKKPKRDEDDNWSPRIKVGHLNPREHIPTRVGARREYVEKGLEKAAAKLASVPQKLEKRKYKARKKKIDDEAEPATVSGKSFVSVELPGPSSARLTQGAKTPILTSVGRPGLAAASQISNVNAHSSTLPKKPKKGMATPKQRLGKILGIHKFTKF